MTGEGAETSGATRTGIDVAVTVLAAAVLAVIVAMIMMWNIRLQASATQVPLVTNAAPQGIAAGAGESTDTAGPTDGGPAGKSATASSSPLNRIDHAWAARAAAATGIPDRAFLAYVSADLAIETKQPACGLG